MRYVNTQCPECGFVATEENPMEKEIEECVDTGEVKDVIVCPECGNGFYR